LILTDPDRVERHNLLRQNFYAGDLGQYKSQTLAERLARLYDREIGYLITPYEAPDYPYYKRGQLRVTIGCVDNAAARSEIAAGTKVGQSLWIDAGNSFNSGQVLVGNITQSPDLRDIFYRDGTVVGLPAPSLQAPGLLIPAEQAPGLLIPAEAPKIDCAEAVAANEQSPVINQAMAALVLEAVRKLVAGELDWMAAYLDLEMGTLQYSRINPTAVARIGAVRRDTLFADRKEHPVKKEKK
jgi:hypothetical protein